ncbi:FitA-like ribbon-helix-helix domain-containing protein [Ornithinimicrobium cryptoxanthini]|uniref:Antitoxin FitA-like ribbon-helix-helix domain-containing protein n=1 Tax=Ornithinimicrobium cryptoxanthini TaxID=2934161 RepID=A0ABY4YFC6_9MICO|nr:hypothetical protein [Ornithinimicrobium cryptoxanthini]USQ75476.1 hypothetical protein NF557_12725 [Ornithinimicrobium cryptoxanthini]
MGVLMQIRDVDEAVRDTLKARAATEGVSLNTYLRTLLSQAAATPTRQEVFDRIASRAERSDASSVDLVRQLRDATSPRDTTSPREP